MLTQNAETDVAIITDAANMPDKTAVEIISHLFFDRKRFILYNLLLLCGKIIAVKPISGTEKLQLRPRTPTE